MQRLVILGLLGLAGSLFGFAMDRLVGPDIIYAWGALALSVVIAVVALRLAGREWPQLGLSFGRLKKGRKMGMSPFFWATLGVISAIITIASLLQAYTVHRDGWPLKVQFGSFMNAIFYPPINGLEIWGVEGFATNVSGNEVKLDAAYLVSGKGGQRLPVTFADPLGNYMDATNFNPMPPTAIAYFRTLFNTDKAHISEKDFWNNWGPITIILKYGDREYRRTFSIKEIEQQFAARRPPPTAPRITPKKETPNVSRPDYSKWDKMSEFTLLDLACLWLDREPRQHLDDAEKDQFRKLESFINGGMLKKKGGSIRDSLNDAWDRVEDQNMKADPSWTVEREWLRELAEAIGEKPPFLFRKERV